MLNHVVLMGRLARDPELRRTGSGLAVANFCVAVGRDYPDKATGETKADFINCVAWRQTGEFVSDYFKKGSMIVVSGRLQVRDWTDDSGTKRYVTEVIAENVYFGESKRPESEGNGSGNGTYNHTKPSTNAYSNSPYYSPPGGPFNVNGVKPAVQVPSDSDWMFLDDDAQLPF